MRAALSGRAKRGTAGVLIAWITIGATCGGRPGKPIPVPPAVDVDATVYLVGDAGEPDHSGEPVLSALHDAMAETSPPAVVIFLGDNIYPAGMPRRSDPARPDAEWRLREQINAVPDGGEAVFAPGNHDWNYAGFDGRGRVLEQERYGLEIGRGRVTFAPGSACPGPWVRDIGERTRLLVLDTQWWLLEGVQASAPESGCALRTDAAILDSIRGALRSAGDRQVIAAGHHPLVSGGVHGGHFTVRQHIFPLTDIASWLWLPLPVLGSAYPLARQLGISNQDLSSKRYRRMREQLESAFAVAPPLIYAAGHDHSLQLLRGAGARYQVVSGTGTYGHNSPVGYTDRTLYAAPGASGYVRLQVQRDGRVRLTVIRVDEAGEREELFSTFLE